jgi:hypothetical protein
MAYIGMYFENHMTGFKGCNFQTAVTYDARQLPSNPKFLL